MNIVYNCNDAFAVHTAVSIASLFENNKSTDRIEVYILANGVSEANGRRFKQLAAEYDSKTHPRHINIIRLEDYGKVLELAFGGEIDTAGFNNIKEVKYENMRHEILNEKDKEKVYSDVVNFLG